MATFALIHGAGDSSWHWHLVEPELRKLGHDTVAVDLPCEDDAADLNDYADAVARAIGVHHDVIVVAQSFGGFTAPLVCERTDVDLMVFLSAMLPAPGETPSEYWTKTSWRPPDVEPGTADGFDPDQAWTVAAFMHDLPDDIAREALKRERAQSESFSDDLWPLDRWPDVPARFLLCRDDRFFTPEWMREVVRERLGIEPDEIDGSHCVALSRPRELAAKLSSYADEITGLAKA